MTSSDLSSEFTLNAGVIYLNHAAVAPWPRRTAEAVQRFAEENATLGALNYVRWIGTEARLREQLRQLLNAPSSSDIALLKNTSEGLSFVAYGLDWRPGDNIVTGGEEFPSNRIVWESLARQGVELRQARLTDAEDPEQVLLDLMDTRTRLLTVSSVQYASGLTLDLPWLGTACRRRGVLFCVDAIQSIGALQTDVQHWQADFVVADGHKWMLGPEGLAVFYCRPELREQLQLHEYGWHMTDDPGNYDRADWRPATSARRFECGSPNMLGIYALSASLSLLLEVGMDTVEREVRAKTRYLVRHLQKQSDKVTLLSPTEEGRYAGIVTFKLRDCDSLKVVDALRARGIVCACRGGGIRFSPHFYTREDQIEAAVRASLETAARFSGRA